MKIVIIGAGIAGCTAYLELKKHLSRPTKSDGSHDITIYEAYNTNPSITPDERIDEHTHSSTLLVGGGLGLAPNGLNVLKRLDEELLKDVVRGGSSSDDNVNNGTNRSPYMLATSRHSLWAALRGRIPEHHIIHKRITQVIARSDERNLIHFADNSSPVEADLVIGADGVRGIAKRALFPDAKEDPYPPNYEGLVGVGGFIPAADVKDLVEPGSMNFIFGGNGFFGYFFSESAVSAANRDSPYHVSEPGDSLAWWSTYEIEECPDRETLDMADVTRQLRERHANWTEPVVQKVIQSLQVKNMYPTWTLPPLPTWERDGVVLVGDAAHALPPSSGQGSSQALEDVEAFALLLAHCLDMGDAHRDEVTPKAQKNAIKAAASQYVNLRQPHVNAILEFAQKTQNSKREMGIFKEYAMYAVMKIMGFFPSFMRNKIRAVAEYNIADNVTRVITNDN
ncbi:unnamed protein product [Penicillium glandicola]